MAKDVKVILLEDIASLGKAGDIVTVSEGYARNALFPQGKGALATEGMQEQQRQKEAKKSQEAQALLSQLQAIAEKMDNTELALQGRVKDGEEIYGSITPKHIVEELNKQTGLSLGPKDISQKKPVKKIGSYDLTVSLSPDVEFTMKLVVEPSPDSEASHEEE